MPAPRLGGLRHGPPAGPRRRRREHALVVHRGPHPHHRNRRGVLRLRRPEVRVAADPGPERGFRQGGLHRHLRGRRPRVRYEPRVRRDGQRLVPEGLHFHLAQPVATAWPIHAGDRRGDQGLRPRAPRDGRRRWEDDHRAAEPRVRVTMNATDFRSTYGIAPQSGMNVTDSFWGWTAYVSVSGSFVTVTNSPSPGQIVRPYGAWNAVVASIDDSANGGIGVIVVHHLL